YWAAILLVGALAVAAWRDRATSLIHGVGLVMLPIAGWSLLGGNFAFEFFGDEFYFDGILPLPTADTFLRYAFAIALIFLAGGCLLAQRFIRAGADRRASWAFWGAAIPVWVLASAWISHG